MITCDELYNLIKNLNCEKELEQKYEELIKQFTDWSYISSIKQEKLEVLHKILSE